MKLGLDGKIAIVTGAASGLGAAIAMALAQEGCRVWIADRDRPAADGTAKRLRSMGLDAKAVSLDVTQTESVAQTFAHVVAAEGRLDILVNSAGVLTTGPFRDAPASTWDALAAVNLTGVVNCVREAIGPITAAGGGRIINIASVAAMRGGGMLGNVLYGTTKAGVVALTTGLARELGPVQITVNAVAPSVVETPMTQPGLTDAMRQHILGRIPLRRLATADDVAAAVLFLASERAAFITGIVVPVDGGLLTT